MSRLFIRIESPSISYHYCAFKIPTQTEGEKEKTRYIAENKIDDKLFPKIVGGLQTCCFDILS